MIKRSIVMGFCAVMTMLGANAMAVEKGDWLIRVGASNISPDGDNGTINLQGVLETPNPVYAGVDVDDAWGLTFNISYFLTNHIAVELLAAAPYEHDFVVSAPDDDLLLTGDTKHLPPTLSIQYHFNASESFKPYVGAGVNFTTFFDSNLDDVPLSVELDDSWGLALQVGADITLTEHWFANVDLRYIELESDLEVANVDVGKVEVDPWVFGLHVGYKF